jgi:hypothetical protein
MVEPQIVVLVVAGSSPVGHPGIRVQQPGSISSDFWIWSSIHRARTAPEPRALGKGCVPGILTGAGADENSES